MSRRPRRPSRPTAGPGRSGSAPASASATANPVRADAFAQAIHRTMAPGVDSPGYDYTRAIVGAEDVHAGRSAKRASGVDRARATRSSSASPVRCAEFDAWTTMPFFCAVPPALQPSAEGVREFPGAGPYYVKEYRLNRKVEIRRNPYYGGNREHHVDGFDVELSRRLAGRDGQPGRPPARADWTYTLPAIALGPSHRSRSSKYSVNFERFWLTPGLDRLDVRPQLLPPALPEQPTATTRRSTSPSTEMCSHVPAARRPVSYLPPGVAGLHGSEPSTRSGQDLVRAGELAAGNLRDGKAVFFVPDVAPARNNAQLIGEQLAKIGLDVEIQPVRRARHRIVVPRAARLGRAVGPRARALDARLRRSLRVHQPALRQRSSPARRP